MVPKVEDIRNDGSVTRILLSGDIGVPMLNALRRVSVSEVPSLAIEWIDISKNTTAHHDELLARRMGLIPLAKKVIANIPLVGECCEGGCSACSYKIALSVSNPIDSERSIHVMSDDFDMGDTGIVPLPDISIALLSAGQAVEIEATVMKGTGSTHAKWSPVSVSNFGRTADGTPFFEVENDGSADGEQIIMDSIGILLSKVRSVKDSCIKYSNYMASLND